MPVAPAISTQVRARARACRSVNFMVRLGREGLTQAMQELVNK
jgi:hypothetical protein